MGYDAKMAFYLSTINILRKRRRLIWVDETVFSPRGWKKMAFSSKGRNINVEGNARSDGCEAVVAAIDTKDGLVHYLQKKKSIK